MKPTLQSVDLLSGDLDNPRGVEHVDTTFAEPGELQVPIIFEGELRAHWRALGFTREQIEEMLAEARRVER